MTSVARSPEDARPPIHIALGVVALLPRVLPWWPATALAAGAALASADALRRYGIRPFLFHPFAWFGLLLLFFDRPDIVAAAWAIFCVGSGVAALLERHAAGAFAGFVLLGGAAGAWVACWYRPLVIPPPYWWFSIAAPFIAALAAAGVRNLPIAVPRALLLPFIAGGVLWSGSIISGELAERALGSFITALPAALVVNAAAACAGYTASAVSRSGAICGAVIGMIVMSTLGLAGWALLVSTLACAVLATRLGASRKSALRIAEPNRGRRGAANAIANTGVATAAALLAALSYAERPATIAFVAALTAAGSDTIASEIGKAYGRRTFLVTTLKRVPPGTSGAVSVEGTIAGIAGAVLLASAAVALGLVHVSRVLPVMAAVLIASTVESVLGATLEHRGILDNDVLNAITTATAAMLAVVFAGA